MSADRFNLLSFKGKMKILHMSWIAFFLTFVIWFNLAPLTGAIKETFGLSKDEISTLLILNVALTIPARVAIGTLTDRFGPRNVYSALLALSAIPCFAFAFADNFIQLAIARFALGCVGAGFVIGIRMVSEWFPPRELGTAEGIYGGWGNFGSAAAAFTLPSIALLFGGDEGWRYAIALTGLAALIYSVIYYLNVSDAPEGSRYFKSKHTRGMEVTSKGDFFLLLVMKAPLQIALGLLAWRLNNVGLISETAQSLIWTGLGGYYLFTAWQAWEVNKPVFEKPVPHIHRYKFKQVAILNILYFASFGSELAVVSMLPLFFAETFGLSPVLAGMVASAYAFMNLVSRASGGLISDRFGRRGTLIVLTIGMAVGYLLMFMINAAWPVALAVAVAMFCSFFVQAAEGAVFAMVPLIKRRVTGQIAGMTGAYGSVGAVTFLVVYSMVPASVFFLVIGATALIGVGCSLLLEEPQGEMAEVDEDGNVTMIPVTA
ncbi:NarK family nitrate/nitrite MFS transporter [Henriciella aquimarina]|uniref:NarK family nitrate/nitrite MFS transporter n=1 Tax=Henriciella aquimarina TaxID=545261 RepID=UPI0009FFC86E